MTTEVRKPKKRWYWKWTVGLALLLCLALGIVWHTRKRSLLEKSTRIATIQDMSDHPVHCLSDHQILFARVAVKQGLYLYDTRTQKEMLLRSVSHELSIPDELFGGNFERRLDSLCVSPDGTRLLWLSGWMIYNGPPMIKPVFGAWLDGSHYFKCNPSPLASGHAETGIFKLSQVRWTGDSRHWVAFIGMDSETTQAILYNGDPSHESKTFPTITSDTSVNPILEVDGSGDRQSLVLGDHLLTWAPRDYMRVTPAVDILDLGIGAHATVKKRSIPLLPHTTLMQVAFSPQGDRIAWHQAIEEIPEWIRTLQHWFPQMHMRGAWQESLWVSRIDGTEMHEIGIRKMKADEQSTPSLSDLQWVPGSNRLGFRFGAAFYTVSAE